MIVADRKGMGLQLLPTLVVVHLVGDAGRRRREPGPPLAVAFEFIVRYQLLKKLERFLEVPEPLQPECLPLRAGDPERQRVDRRCVRCFSEFGGVISDPVGIAVETLHDRLTDLFHGRDGSAHLLSHRQLYARTRSQEGEVAPAADPADELAADEHDRAVIATATRPASDALLDTLREQRAHRRVGGDVHTINVVVGGALRKIIHYQEAASVSGEVDSVIAIGEHNRPEARPRLYRRNLRGYGG